MFHHLQKLYKEELYSAALPIGSLVLNAYEANRNSLTADQHLLALWYYANCLLNQRYHRRAEEVFDQILMAKKGNNSNNNKLPRAARDLAADSSRIGDDAPMLLLGDDDGGREARDAAEVARCCSMNEIRYKLASCEIGMGLHEEAIINLQAVPIRQRSLAMNVQLVRLLQAENVHDKRALGPLRAILAECPMHLEAIRMALQCGMKATDVSALLREADAGVADNTQWLLVYVVAMSCLLKAHYDVGIKAMQTLQAPAVSGDETLLVLLGQLHYYKGEPQTALEYLHRALILNPYLGGEGLQLVAVLYAQTGRLAELERLTQRDFEPAIYSSEYWFVLAQQLFVQRDFEKAARFVQKALCLRPKNVEAILLNVKILKLRKEYTAAITALRNLQQFANYRFEVHEQLVDTYIQMNRLCDAQVIGRDLFNRAQVSVTARHYVLLVRPYIVQYKPQHRQRLKGLLQRALEKDYYHLPAAMLLLALMRTDGDRVGTGALLRKQLARHPNSKMYEMLGDLLSEEKDEAKAMEYYSIAINLDPKNSNAVNQLMALGQKINPKACMSGDSKWSTKSADGTVGTSATTVVAPSDDHAMDGLWKDIEGEPSMDL